MKKIASLALAALIAAGSVSTSQAGVLEKTANAAFWTAKQPVKLVWKTTKGLTKASWYTTKGLVKFSYMHPAAIVLATIALDQLANNGRATTATTAATAEFIKNNCPEFIKKTPGYLTNGFNTSKDFVANNSRVAKDCFTKSLNTSKDYLGTLKNFFVKNGNAAKNLFISKK